MNFVWNYLGQYLRNCAFFIVRRARAESKSREDLSPLGHVSSLSADGWVSVGHWDQGLTTWSDRPQADLGM